VFNKFRAFYATCRFFAAFTRAPNHKKLLRHFPLYLFKVRVSLISASRCLGRRKETQVRGPV